MAEASIPVDLFNPGQVFACIGFLEAADVLIGDAEGAFDWSNATDTRFVLRASGDENPFVATLKFLAASRVCALAPVGSSNDTRKWNVPTSALRLDAPFPYPDPSSPATLPASFTSGDAALTIDYWGDETCRDNVKFWGGGGGYPGVAIANDALEIVRARCIGAASDPFALAGEQSSSFRFDWRRDYIPIDAGFSLNSHTSVNRITATGFPLVELLAAIGLTNARPTPLEKRSLPLEYRYAVIGTAVNSGAQRFDPILLRAALGGVLLPFPRRSFRMHLGWPAQVGQARAITTVTEEASR